MEGESYTVYMHRLYDGRVYIGITSKSPEQRWKNGRGYDKNRKFYNAIVKYGWDSFEHIVLETGLSKEDAEKREVELIAEYDSTSRKKGFNVSLGGSGGVPLSEEVKEQLREKATGRKASRETKEKMSATRKGQKQSEEHIRKRAQTRVGTHLSEETKRKIGLAISAANTGRKHSEETKRKQSENSGRARRVVQVGPDGEDICAFRSLSEAGKACNTSPQNIWMAANHFREHAGGFMWRYEDGGRLQ